MDSRCGNVTAGQEQVRRMWSAAKSSQWKSFWEFLFNVGPSGLSPLLGPFKGIDKETKMNFLDF